MVDDSSTVYPDTSHFDSQPTQGACFSIVRTISRVQQCQWQMLYQYLERLLSPVILEEKSQEN